MSSSITVTGGTPYTVQYNTDWRKRIESESVSVSGTNLTYNFEYDSPDNRLKKTILTNKFESEYIYDKLSRMGGKNFKLLSGNQTFNESYTYHDALNSNGAKSGTTGYIKTHTNKSGTTTYSYDKSGNISKVVAPLVTGMSELFSQLSVGGVNEQI